MNGTVVALTRDARDAWGLLKGSLPVADRLGCPLVLMLAFEGGDTQSVALEYAFQCARKCDVELMAFSGERAMGRMFAEAHRRQVRCVTTRDDPALLAKLVEELMAKK